MVDLERVRTTLNDGLKGVPYSYTLLDIVDELEAARQLIRAQARHDKLLHKYQALINGVSEEAEDVNEVGDSLAIAAERLLAAQEKYLQAVDESR